MSHFLSSTLLACALALAATPAAFGADQPTAPAAKAAAKARPHPKAQPDASPEKTAPATKAAAKARPHPKAQPDKPREEPDADISDTTITEYQCELGNKITIFHNDNDSGHIALRWKKKIHRLERVGTTTGALRFENLSYGLIWIGIPSKGMLLDSKLNRQLANECKNAEQSRPAVADPAEAKKS